MQLRKFGFHKISNNTRNAKEKKIINVLTQFGINQLKIIKVTLILTINATIDNTNNLHKMRSFCESYLCDIIYLIFNIKNMIFALLALVAA